MMIDSSRSKMPNVKRCELEEIDCVGEDDLYPVKITKKPRVDENYVGEIPVDYTSIINSWCTGVSPGVADGNKSNSSGKSLLKSSRGRVSVRPSRFSNSAIGSWKKENLEVGEFELCVGGNKGIMSENIENQCTENKFSSEMSYMEPKDPLTARGSCNSDGVSSFCANAGGKSTAKVARTENVGKRKDFFRPEDFVLGDIVWAKCSKRYPAWPAIVIDPLWQAPESVLRACVPNTICVMFYGYSRRGQRDYAWVKDGMIFPFLEYMDRFRGQTQLYGSKPSDFRMAIEEAFLAENGYIDTCLAIEQENSPEPNHSKRPDMTCSSEDQEYRSRNQTVDKKDTQPCGSCGMVVPCKTMRKAKGTSQKLAICEHCAKLRKSKQYCGICKKIWHHSNGRNWICCDGCDVWVHAECAKVPSKYFKNLEDTEYYCPECKQNTTYEEPKTKMSQPQLRTAGISEQTVLLDKITVLGWRGFIIQIFI